jgi:hypothetical protein
MLLKIVQAVVSTFVLAKQRMLAMTNSELAKEIKALGYLIMFALTHILTYPFRRMSRYLLHVLRQSIEVIQEIDLEYFDIGHLLESPAGPLDKLNGLVGQDVIVVSRHHERVCAGRFVSYRRTPAGRITITYIDYTTRDREVICQDIAYFTITPYDEALLFSFKSVLHADRHTLVPEQNSVHWEDLDADAVSAVKRTRVSPCSQYLPSATIDEVIEIMQRRAGANRMRSTLHK